MYNNDTKKMTTEKPVRPAHSGMFGSALLLIGSIIWGAAFVAQRSGMDSIGPLYFNAIRMALAAAAVAPAALYARQREEKRLSAEEARRIRRQTWIGGLCCGGFLAAASVFQQIGLVYTSAGKAGFITALYMLLVPVIRFTVFRRKQPARVWLAVMIGLIGMYLLCVKEGFSLERGDALMVLCAVMFSGQILCCDYYCSRARGLGLAAIEFAVAAAVSAVGAALTETFSVSQLFSAMIPILYCGLLSGGVGYTLQIYGQKYTDPSVASLLMSLESVFAALSGALLLGERMSGRELLGCCVMFAAIILVQIGDHKNKSDL